MRNSLFETLLAALVLVVACGFVMFGYSNTQVATGLSYRVSAQFNEVGDLRPGDEVRIGGLKVGSVVALTLDPETLFPVVELAIGNELNLPDDTAASLRPNGLLGGLHVALDFGISDRPIPSGGRIKKTRGVRNILDEVVGEFLGTLETPMN